MLFHVELDQHAWELLTWGKRWCPWQQGVGGGEDHVIMVMMLVVMVIVHLRAKMVPIELRVRNSSGRAWHSDLPWWLMDTWTGILFAWATSEFCHENIHLVWDGALRAGYTHCVVQGAQYLCEYQWPVGKNQCAVQSIVIVIPDHDISNTDPPKKTRKDNHSHESWPMFSNPLFPTWNSPHGRQFQQQPSPSWEQAIGSRNPSFSWGPTRFRRTWYFLAIPAGHSSLQKEEGTEPPATPGQDTLQQLLCNASKTQEERDNCLMTNKIQMCFPMLPICVVCFSSHLFKAKQACLEQNSNFFRKSKMRATRVTKSVLMKSLFCSKVPTVTHWKRPSKRR